MITITINSVQISVTEGTTVAAAIMNLGEAAFRHSADSGPRGPVCGMGICFECRVTIGGEPHQRSCTLLAEEGMEVATRE